MSGESNTYTITLRFQCNQLHYNSIANEINYNTITLLIRLITVNNNNYITITLLMN